MSITIVYEAVCHCGDLAKSSTLAMDQPEEDGRVHIDIEMSIGQMTLTCDNCGCQYGTGDIELFNDDEDACNEVVEGGDQDDDEDES